MDPNAENTPQWPPPNPNRPASFVPMSKGAQAPTRQQQPVQPQQYAPLHPQQSQQQSVMQQPYRAPLPHAPMQLPATKKKPTLNTKPLIIAGIVAGAILLLGTATALFWPKKQAPVATPTPKTTARYYYIDSVQPDTAKPGQFAYSVAFANPETSVIVKEPLTTAPFLVDTVQHIDSPLHFSADGTHYAYATSDSSGLTQPDKATADNYRIVTGAWPQQADKERVLYSETKRNDSRDWIFTQDGKELFYLDIVLDAKNTATTSDLYSVDTATGKSTKIGAIDRPADRENTPLYEFAKDKSIRFYTSQDDGIYETRYDRQTHKLTNKKVIIRDYDLGHMGLPSPDGTKMLYFGTGAEDYTVYLLDLVEGGSTPLIATPAKYGGYSDGVWSPDSKMTALTANIKDIDGKHYENQMILVDTVLRSTANNIFLRNKSPDTDNSASFYRITSWSPDGNYLTYIQNNQLYFYDVKGKKTVDTLKITDRDQFNNNTIIGGWTLTASK